MFDTLSGSIHVLDTLTAWMLRLLVGAPAALDARAIAAQLAPETGPFDDEEPIASRLAELERLGLVERCHP